MRQDPMRGNRRKGKRTAGKGILSSLRKTDAELVKDRVDHVKELYEKVKVEVDEEDLPDLQRELARRDERVVNLLDMVPKRAARFERSGRYLLVPIYSTKRGERIARFLRLRTRRRIRLDRYGWHVWELLNGKRNVKDIGERLRSRYGESIEPLYPRLAKFLAYLESLKLVEIKRP